MTNEEFIEELLLEALELGIHAEVLELSKEYQKSHSIVDSINRALEELKSEIVKR